ncbi:DUF2474 domain-containing protein [Enterovibrio sp. ZSDZ35]|uniref:DUF2474 domain-containing protein n=1 Tax=Enterovibrio qingdaonensis TaxID=2899818 RepID=A0ABT5QNH3_9GAMM|nr:DUF2474 domain-containing protein [Enterovibrio sp. ZSDZ35]MDD1782527.1 DUF2474 domain-containing protein [Enterovibrio sp. ZSDZ35]
MNKAMKSGLWFIGLWLIGVGAVSVLALFIKLTMKWVNLI